MKKKNFFFQSFHLINRESFPIGMLFYGHGEGLHKRNNKKSRQYIKVIIISKILVLLARNKSFVVLNFVLLVNFIVGNIPDTCKKKVKVLLWFLTRRANECYCCDFALSVLRWDFLLKSKRSNEEAKGKEYLKYFQTNLQKKSSLHTNRGKKSEPA